MSSGKSELFSIITAVVKGPLGTVSHTAVGLGNIVLTVSYPGHNPESPLDYYAKNHSPITNPGISSLRMSPR